MSRSYRKNVFATWVHSKRMKSWRTQENRRLRHNAKQLINTCEDYDRLIIPVLNDYDTLWGSPNDGRKKPWDKPLLNQCEIDHHKYVHCWGLLYRYARDEYDGAHYKDCVCYDNKKGEYWKVKRK